MTILGRNILAKHGPYICFGVTNTRFNEAWPNRLEYEAGIFIEFSDDLLGIYCSLTHSYSPFDQYAFIQLEKPYDIYEFTAKLLIWESQLAKTPENYFTKELNYLESSDACLQGDKYTPSQLKADLLETLHFMIEKMHKAASKGQCVIIEGI